MRRSKAITEGFVVPPHIGVIAASMVRRSFSFSCSELATKLDRLIKHLATVSARGATSAQKEGHVNIDVPTGKPDRVFVIHGRNMQLLDQLRVWLESLGLHAKGFDAVRADMGGSPTVLQVIRTGMDEARGIIALMTPDEIAFLRPELHYKHDAPTDQQRWQARPNVIFEAGMAFALAGYDRTLLLVAGAAELFSDVAGIHYKKFPHDATERELLRKTLHSMGLAVRDDPTHLKRGEFDVPALDRLKTRSPFES